MAPEHRKRSALILGREPLQSPSWTIALALMGFRLSLASDVQAGLDRLRDFEFTFVLANIEALGDDPVLACSHLSAARGQHRDAWALVLIDVHEAHSETYRELVGAGADLVHPGAPARDSLYEWVRLAELRSISNGFDART